MSSPGTDLMPNGGDLLDDHATPGYSRLTTAHSKVSDSPGELPKIVGIAGRQTVCVTYFDEPKTNLLTIMVTIVAQRQR